MEREELLPIIRQAIRDELPAIVEAVIREMGEIKKVKEEAYWATMSKEEYEKLTGS